MYTVNTMAVDNLIQHLNDSLPNHIEMVDVYREYLLGAMCQYYEVGHFKSIIRFAKSHPNYDSTLWNRFTAKVKYHFMVCCHGKFKIPGIMQTFNLPAQSTANIISIEIIKFLIPISISEKEQKIIKKEIPLSKESPRIFNTQKNKQISKIHLNVKLVDVITKLFNTLTEGADEQDRENTRRYFIHQWYIAYHRVLGGSSTKNVSRHIPIFEENSNVSLVLIYTYMKKTAGVYTIGEYGEIDTTRVPGKSSDTMNMIGSWLVKIVHPSEVELEEYLMHANYHKIEWDKINETIHPEFEELFNEYFYRIWDKVDITNKTTYRQYIGLKCIAWVIAGTRNVDLTGTYLEVFEKITNNIFDNSFSFTHNIGQKWNGLSPFINPEEIRNICERSNRRPNTHKCRSVMHCFLSLCAVLHKEYWGIIELNQKIINPYVEKMKYWDLLCEICRDGVVVENYALIDEYISHLTKTRIATNFKKNKKTETIVSAPKIYRVLYTYLSIDKVNEVFGKSFEKAPKRSTFDTLCREYISNLSSEEPKC